MDLPAFDDDDTGKLRTEAAKRDASDPGGELRGLAVAQIAHEASDARKWRTVAWLCALLVSLILVAGGAAWTAQAQVTANTTRIESMQRQLDHIEQQVDRLVERSLAHD